MSQRPGSHDGAETFRTSPAATPPAVSAVPSPMRVGPRVFAWGTRTFVMGVLNATPDSFSGDGVFDPADAAGGAGGRPSGGPPDPIAAAVARADRMVADGADILDVGGESSRPGHDPVEAKEEARRVVPVVAAVRLAHPGVAISVDTTKPAVAEAALDAGADLLNDVWGVAEDDALCRVAAERGAPIVLMHNRGETRYRALIAEVVADLERAIERAMRAGVAWEAIIVDPGFGFGKTPDHNLELLRRLEALCLLGRPVLLGTSRKSTLGKVLDLPVRDRLEATLATTALAIAAGVDIVRVHDVRENVRAARMADAVVRGWRLDASASSDLTSPSLAASASGRDHAR